MINKIVLENGILVIEDNKPWGICFKPKDDEAMIFEERTWCCRLCGYVSNTKITTCTKCSPRWRVSL